MKKDELSMDTRTYAEQLRFIFLKIKLILKEIEE